MAPSKMRRALVALSALLLAARPASASRLALGPMPRFALRAARPRALPPLRRASPHMAAAAPAPPRDAPARTCIVGGGPAGLATALMLARRGWENIHVYDRLAPPPEPDDEQAWSETARFYLIGIGARGQSALRAIGAWEAVEAYSAQVVGRKDWAPGAGPDEGVERIFDATRAPTRVIARDRLVGVLLRVLRTRHGAQVAVHHGVEAEGVAWAADGRRATLTLRRRDLDGAREPAAGPLPPEPPADGARRGGAEAAADAAAADAGAGAGAGAGAEAGGVWSEEAELLIGADGTARTIANALHAARPRDFRVTRYPDDNARVYKTVPLQLPPGWRGDVNYSARSADGRINFDALPARAAGGAEGGASYCGVLLLREGDPLAAPATDPAALRSALDQVLPQFSSLLGDATVAAVAAKPPSALPAFRYVGPRLHHGGCTLLLGDAIHTVKPYFGLGANSALEDVAALQAALDGAAQRAPEPGAAGGGGAPPGPQPAAAERVPQALSAFSRARGPEARHLVRISRALDRPGALGFVTFVLPLILDGLCHGALPALCAPNTIAMLQRAELSFAQVARRKRLDRAVQVAALAAGLAGAAALARAAARALLGARVGRALLAVAAAAAALGFARAAAPWLVRGLSPGDVLAKLSRRKRAGGGAAAAPAGGADHSSVLMAQRMSQRGYGTAPAAAEGAASAVESAAAASADGGESAPRPSGG